jgi:hypothetical protein
MSQVVRYFHIRPLKRQNKEWVYQQRHGATVRVVGDTENIGKVQVQFAFCSGRDMYCKKIGRLEAIKAEVRTISLRHLPSELHQISEEVDARTKSRMTEDTDYGFAMKYFLPK